MYNILFLGKKILGNCPNTLEKKNQVHYKTWKVKLSYATKEFIFEFDMARNYEN